MSTITPTQLLNALQSAGIVFEDNGFVGNGFKEHVDLRSNIEAAAAKLTADLAAHPSRGVVDEAEPGAIASLVAAANATLAANPHDDTMWSLEAAVAPFNASKPAECASGCPPQQVCDYCQVAAMHAIQAAALPAAPARNMEQVRSEAFNLADTVIEWIESGNVQAARDAIRDSLVALAAPPAVPDTWQERLRAEHAELDERFTKLCAFLESEKFASLNEDDRRILMAQGNGMRVYLNALTFRVDQLDYAATPAHDQPEGEG